MARGGSPHQISHLASLPTGDGPEHQRNYDQLRLDSKQSDERDVEARHALAGDDIVCDSAGRDRFRVITLLEPISTHSTPGVEIWRTMFMPRDRSGADGCPDTPREYQECQIARERGIAVGNHVNCILWLEEEVIPALDSPTGEVPE